MSGLLSEFKRRHVFRVAGSYLVFGWIAMQVVEVMAPALNLPGWVDGFVALLLIVGFPVAIFLAWVFDLTPEGLKRTKPLGEGEGVHQFGAADWAILVALVVVIALLSVQIFSRRDERRSPMQIAVVESPAVIAVLPFANVSGDPRQEHISDGIAIDIVGQLQRFRVFPVISLNSTFAYKGAAVNVTQVGEDLAADYIVEGTLRRRGDTLRVTAQLSDAKTGFSLWSHTYDREFDALFALQDEITRSVVASIAPEIQQSEVAKARVRTTDDMHAYELYLKGLRLDRNDSFDEMMQARTTLLAAVDRDPTFSPAWVELAWIEHDMTTYHAGSTTIERATEARDRGLAYAQQAVRFDAQSGEAHCVLGHMLLHFQRQDNAMIELARSVELNPSSANILSNFGWGQITARQYDAGIATIARARELNPNGPLVWEYVSNAAWAHWWKGDSEGAIELAKESLRLNPGNPYMLFTLAAIHTERGEDVAALAALVEFRRVSPDYTFRSLPLTSFPADRIAQFQTLLKAAGWTEPTADDQS